MAIPNPVTTSLAPPTNEHASVRAKRTPAPVFELPTARGVERRRVTAWRSLAAFFSPLLAGLLYATWATATPSLTLAALALAGMALLANGLLFGSPWTAALQMSSGVIVVALALNAPAFSVPWMVTTGGVLILALAHWWRRGDQVQRYSALAIGGTISGLFGALLMAI